MRGRSDLARFKLLFALATTRLGLRALGTIFLMWLLIGYAIRVEFRRHSDQALRDTSNLARIAEAQLVGRLAAIDSTLRFGQMLYRQNPAGFDLGTWIGVLPDADIVQGALIGQDGRVRATTTGPLRQPVDLADRAYIARAISIPVVDELSISEPLIGRVTGLSTINFVRPVIGSGGEAAGAILVSVLTSSFSRLYESLDLMAERITVFGLDGVVRARVPGTPEAIGVTAPDQLIAPFRAGTVQISERRSSAFDGSDRFDTLRRVAGYPLVVMVGVEARTALADAGRTATWLVGLGGLLSLLTIAVGLASARLRRLEGRSRAHLEGVIGHVGQGMVMIDPAGRIAVMNTRFESLLGLPPGLAVPGRPINEIIAWQEQAGEFGGGPAPLLHQVAATGVRPPLVTERTRPDGTVLEIRTEYLADGSQVRTFGDITESRRAAGAIAAARDQALAAEAALAAALENVPHGVLLVDRDRTVLVVNSRAVALLDLPPDLARAGCSIGDIIRWQRARGDLDGLPVQSPLLDPGRPALTPDLPAYERTTPDGKVLEVRTTALADGRVIRTYTDVTDRRAALREQAMAREAAEAALRARTEFLAVVSHELRTPLHAVIGLSGVLLAQQPTADQAEVLRMIEAAGQKLLALVNDILEVTRLERGQVTLVEAPFDLRATLRAAAAPFAAQAEAKGLRFGHSVDGSVPAQLVGDDGRLQQVLRILLGNAVKFTESGGITLAATVLGEAAGRLRLGISVTDTGIGIPAEFQSQLFHPFRQADSSYARPFGGAGLGLALCRLLLEAMGGSIAFESRSGAGSSFRCEMSLRVPPVAQPGLAQPGQAKIALAGRRVLLAAATPEVAVSLLPGLRARGHVVEHVTDGVAAVAAMRDRAFDVALLDIALPGLDGVAVTRAIRALPGPAGRLPVIALGDTAVAALVAQCRAAGIDRLEGLPVDLDALVHAIQAATSREAA